MTVTVIKLTGVLFLALNILGCGNTPYRDDYTKQVNRIPPSSVSAAAISYQFDKQAQIDIRGKYSRNDEIGATNFLYHGGAGLIGIIAQVGAHSAMVSTQRNDRLAEQQKEANLRIQPIINAIQGTLLSEIIPPNFDTRHVIKNTEQTLVNIKPIFFSNDDMNVLSLSLLAWIGNRPSIQDKKKAHSYRNLIQVHSPPISFVEFSDTLQDNPSPIQNILSKLLYTALNIVQNDLTGKYHSNDSAEKTFIIGNNGKNKIVRGRIVDQECGFNIIRNLHSWFIAVPNNNEVLVRGDQCNIDI